MATLTESQRKTLVTNCKLLNQYQNLIGYEQIRPFPLVPLDALEAGLKAGTQYNEWDCSASIIEICLISGIMDPSGYNFNGDGDSLSMLARLKNYTNPARAQPGALVVFGADLALGNQHVCMVTIAGTNPQLFSHGETDSCKLLTLSQEQTAHTGQTVFLDMSQQG